MLRLRGGALVALENFGEEGALTIAGNPELLGLTYRSDKKTGRVVAVAFPPRQLGVYSQYPVATGPPPPPQASARRPPLRLLGYAR